jgi:hypothetical protein
MVSCNMCRNGWTALGKKCPNGCRAKSLSVYFRLFSTPDPVPPKQATYGPDYRHALYEIINRIEEAESQGEFPGGADAVLAEVLLIARNVTAYD